MADVREITGQTLDVSVGEMISLAPAFVDETFGVLKSVKWSIDPKGKIVQGYNADPQTNVKIKSFPDEAYEKTRVEFYWTDKGQGLVVEADCVYSKGRKTLKATYNVKRPRVDSFEVVVNSAGVDIYGNKMSIGYGRGIVFRWSVSADGASNGELKDIQLMIDDRSMIDETGCRWVSRVRGAKPGDWVLDNSNPYADPGGQPVWQAYGGGPAPWPMRGSATHPGIEDSPCSGLPRTIKNPRAKKEVLTIAEKSVSDQFQYYLMYKSERDLSIWIPIARVDWHWSCTARFSETTNRWSVVSKSLSNSPPVLKNQYIKPPEWTWAGGSEKGLSKWKPG